MTNEYTALQGIMAPNTSVFGYRRGDAVSAQVVDDWALEVGADVCEGDLDPDAPVEPVVPKPDPDGTRGEWEAWALAEGMPADDVATASMDDLQGWQPEHEPAAVAGDPNRPADSAKKADWAAYAESRGADSQWANDPNTTKANLQAYEPEVGDPVALSATDAAQA